MRKVERERFVPSEIRGQAYDDRALPIGYGQTISQPYIVALMTELLGLKGDEKVLEVGTGSGYQAAILGELAKEVYTVEIVTELAERSKNLLAELGYKNVHVRAGDGYQGWKVQAPFSGPCSAAVGRSTERRRPAGDPCRNVAQRPASLPIPEKAGKTRRTSDHSRLVCAHDRNIESRAMSDAQKAQFIQNLLPLLRKQWPKTLCEVNHRNAYELMVGTILAAQSTDKTVNEITPAQSTRIRCGKNGHANGFLPGQNQKHPSRE
jgi:hypothetical protein